jgi:hypothetical protein
LSPRPGAGVSLKTAALLLLVAAAVGLTGALAVRWLLWRGQPAEASDNHRGPAVPLFQGWPRPELVLVLSGEQHGYLLPCGCSRPQVGGLERRYNFVQQLRRKGWPVVALDLGNVAQRQGPRQLPNFQGRIKYLYAMKALREIGYSATSIGEYEAALPLNNALDDLLTNEIQQPRVLVCNFKNPDVFPNETAPWMIAAPREKGTDVKIGVVGAVGQVVAEERIKDQSYGFDSVPKALPRALLALQQQKPAPDLNVLLYQGTMPQAEKLAAAIPDFRVILCLSDDGEHQYDEPATRPQVVRHPGGGETWVIHVGHKGKYVGVVGIFPTGVVTHPFDLRYQLVSMGEEYLTPEDQEANHPILKLMEEYTQELKHDAGNGNYLARYAALQWSHPMQSAFPDAHYVGDDVKACKKCHEAAVDVWQHSKHAHAYETLVKAKKPSLRQYDGECVVCHVVGLGYKTGFTNEKDTPHLRNVSCESCHGPASEHLKDPKNVKVRELLNPWKELAAKPGDDAASQAAARNRRHLLRDQACQKCHDQDNDVHWDFDKKWPLIEHH